MVADFATLCDSKCTDADSDMFGDIRVPVVVDTADDDNDNDVCFIAVV